VVEIDRADAVFDEPAHPYTRALMASLPVLDEPRRRAPLSGELPDPHDPPAGCRFHTRCPVGPLHDPARTICFEADPARDAETRTHRSACHFSPALTLS
jgi:peptide/nickel transport system ATP-binding protein